MVDLSHMFSLLKIKETTTIFLISEKEIGIKTVIRTEL